MEGVDGTVRAVTEEDTMYGEPDRVCRLIRLHDDREYLRQDGRVDPVHDARADGGPIHAVEVEAGVDEAIDVVNKVVHTKDGHEQGTPYGVVRLLKVEDGQDVLPDRNNMDGGSSGRGGSERIGVVARGDGGVVVGHGAGIAEARIG